MSILDKITGFFAGEKNETNSQPIDQPTGPSSDEPAEKDAPVINPEPDAGPDSGEKEKQDCDCGQPGCPSCSQ